MKPDNSRSQSNTPRDSPWWPTLLVVSAFLAVAFPLILSQHDRGRGRFDQVNYHEPTVLRFAEQLPTPDLSDYLSATTPAYHLVLAAVARLLSPSPVVLQMVGACFSLGLLALFTRWVTPRAGPRPAAALGIGLASSLYVLSSGVYLLPDNAGWLGVLGVLLVALRARPRQLLIAGGAVLLGLALTRQTHIWAAGALWAAAWLGAEFRPRAGVAGEIGSLLDEPSHRIRRTLLAILATLPAFGAVACFIWLWGGLTVPIFQGMVQGANPATPAFILVQIAVVGVFHLGFWLTPGWDLVRSKPWLVGLVLIAGLVAALVPETTYSIEDGRFSGLWGIAAKAPVIAGRTSSMFMVLCPAGAAILAAWLAGVRPRDRWVMLAALAGFAAAVSMTHFSWQRYHEPMVLLVAGLLSAMVAEHDPSPPRPLGPARWVGPLVLALLLAGVTATELSAEKPVGKPIERHRAIERPLTELWPEHWERVEAPPGAAPDAAQPERAGSGS